MSRIDRIVQREGCSAASVFVFGRFWHPPCRQLVCAWRLLLQPLLHEQKVRQGTACTPAVHTPDVAVGWPQSMRVCLSFVQGLSSSGVKPCFDKQAALCSFTRGARGMAEDCET